MKTLVESLFDSKTQMTESLFDNDIVKQDLTLDVKTGYDIITKEISKRLSVAPIEGIRNAYLKPSKKGNILWTMIDRDQWRWARINFSVCINDTTTTKNGYGASVTFFLCPTAEGPFRKKSDDVGYLARVDVGWTRFTKGVIDPDFTELWEDNGFKRFSTLKSLVFTEKNMNKIIDYVVNVCSKLRDIVERDSNLISDIADGIAHVKPTESPLTGGRLDKIWYNSKLKKEMVV